MTIPENLNNLPPALFENPHFVRYYRTWQNNELSIVFIPLAEICREQGYLSEARAICEAGLKSQPSSVSGRLMLARILLDLQETQQASDLVDHVLTSYPAQQEARSLAEKIRISHAVAKKTETKESPRSETPPETSDEGEEKTLSPLTLWENPTMAKIYADQGEVRVAKRILDRILSHDPADERALTLQNSLNAKDLKKAAPL